MENARSTRIRRLPAAAASVETPVGEGAQRRLMRQPGEPIEALDDSTKTHRINNRCMFYRLECEGVSQGSRGSRSPSPTIGTNLAPARTSYTAGSGAASR